VDEQIDLAQLARQCWKVTPARPIDESPASLKAVFHGNAYLRGLFGSHRKQVDAPQAPFAVTFHGLQYETRRDSMPYPCFDDDLGLQMAHETPNRANQLWVSIVPTVETFRTQFEALVRQTVHDNRPQFGEFSQFRARPSNANPLVKTFLPTFIGRVNRRVGKSLETPDRPVEQLRNCRSRIDKFRDRFRRMA